MEPRRVAHALASPRTILLLGPLVVELPGSDTPPASPRGLAARLLAMLAVEGSHGLSDTALIDHLWAGMPPVNASFSLRNQIASLRKLLGGAAIVRTAGGYRLDPGICHIDIDRFDEFVRAAEQAVAADDVEVGLARVNDALALVRGPALLDVRHEAWAVRHVEDIDERVRAADDLWASLVVRRPVGADDLSRLRAAAEREPRREVRWVSLIDAYVHHGRRSDALRAAHEARRSLGEIGLRVGAQVVAAEQRALQVEALDPMPSQLPRLLARRDGPFVGRSDALRWLDGAAPVKVMEAGAAVGATRLLAEYAARLDAAGATVVYVRGDGVLDEPRFLASFARELLATAERQEMDPAIRRLLSSDGERSARLDPDTLAALAQRALQQLLDDLAAGGPTTVLVDDAHLLSVDDLRLLARLVERSPTTVSFVIAGRRPVAEAPDWCTAIASGRAVPRLQLLPLRRVDVESLVVAQGVGEPDRDAATAAAWEASGGLPQVALEALAAWLDGRPVGSARWASLLEEGLSGLDDLERRILEVLTLVDRPIAREVLAAAASASPDAVHFAVDRLVEDGFAADEQGRVRAVEGGYAAMVRAATPVGAASALRQRLVDSEVARSTEPALVHALLLAQDDRSTSEAQVLDETFVRVVGDLIVAGSRDAARIATRSYLAAAGAGDASRSAVEARLLASKVLLASADTASEGLALLAVVEVQAQALDDPSLVADAVLARGPVDTGGGRSRSTAAVAEALLHRLPAADTVRRVQLLCWAAHHRVNVGELTSARDLLLDAEVTAGAADDPTWRSLVLAVRAQAELSGGGSPSAALDAIAALQRWSALTGSLTGEAAAALLEVSRAMGSASLVDAEAAVRRVEEVASVLPRSDLRWLPTAATAAVALARDDLDAADAQMAAAAELGRSIGVSGAAPIAAMQQVLLLLARGGLGSLSAVLEAALAGGRPSADRLALHALACVHVGDHERAAASATLLVEHGALLGPAGAAWPLVAMASAEVAWALRHDALAAALWGELARWSGWTLNVHGLAHLGAADTWLGLCAGAQGREQVAADLLEAGATQDERSGAVFWVARARTLQEELRSARTG